MRPTPTWLVCTALLALAVQARAEQVFTTGSEQQINSYTTGNQGFAEIAALPDGGYVATWESFGQDGDSWGVFGQRFHVGGVPAGGEFQVNTTTAEYQWTPTVATDGDGAFVIAWESYAPGGGYDVRAQRFDSSGVVAGTEIEVNSFTAGFQGNASVAASDTGDFLIVWESAAQDQSDLGIFAQLFDSAGAVIGDEFQVNDTTAADQNGPSVVAIDGGYAVTWESLLQDGSDESTILRYLGSDGSPASGEIIVNSFTASDQEDSAIAVAADGTVAVVWEGSGQDGFGEGIFSQVYDSSGAPVGTEMQLNSHTPEDQKNPKVAPDGAGGFVAVWTSEDQLDGTTEEVYARRIDASGDPVGGEFQVNTQSTDDQDAPSVAGGDDRFMVVWRSFGGHDGSAAGVFGQVYVNALFADGFESSDTSAWSVVVP